MSGPSATASRTLGPGACAVGSLACGVTGSMESEGRAVTRGTDMSTQTDTRPLIRDDDDHGADIVRLPRRRIDKLLIAFGVIATVVFAVAGGLLTCGSDFSNGYVHDELSS